MWKVIFADLDTKEGNRVADHYKDDSRISIVSTVCRYEFLPAEICEYMPDAVFLDLSAGEEECIRMMKEIMGNGSATKVIFIAPESYSDEAIQRACEYGYVLRRPFDPAAVKRAVWVLMGEFKVNTHDLRVKVSKTLGNAGIQPHLDGYKFLRDGIVLYVLREGNIPICDIYSDIAARYGKNFHCVERSMRNAIENAWINGDVDYLNSLFGYTVREDRGKPSNREFIAMVADKFIIAK